MKLSLGSHVSDLGSFPICASTTLHCFGSFQRLPKNRDSPSVGCLQHRRDPFRRHHPASMSVTAVSSESVHLLSHPPPPVMLDLSDLKLKYLSIAGSENLSPLPERTVIQ
ncbi:hypothetical protein DY000_02010214 [Brassica cretica]|uniref:Uncharacterized protein n=1 Tax=Brassica cretica TaxID=69181 RepID=A0ABQ7BRZ0_BRACR|nr:hypothetical protein DY000_02010214 [Brassica cretica]